MLRALWSRLTGRPSARCDTRLDEAEALRIATGAAEDLLAGRALVSCGLHVEDGKPVWQFWTATVGSGVTVEVDDETGNAKAECWGVR